MATKKRDELVREWDEKIERGEETVGLTPVRATVIHKADVIYSMRWTPDEIAIVRQAAERSGVKVSGFVRAAVLEAAERGADQTDPVVTRQVREQVKALAETVRRL
jgi:uncharacterized protein (DUF1778 family)